MMGTEPVARIAWSKPRRRGASSPSNSRCAVAERRERPQHADAPALRRLRHALGEPVHDLALPGAQPLEVDLGRGEAHTEPLGLPRVADDARGVEQRLGWDAAAEEADAPSCASASTRVTSTPRSAARKAAA